MWLTPPQGILNEVWKHKLIFVETPDANETSVALENYRKVCQTTAASLLAYTVALISRRATMGVVPSYFLWHVEKCQRV